MDWLPLDWWALPVGLVLLGVGCFFAGGGSDDGDAWYAPDFRGFVLLVVFVLLAAGVTIGRLVG